MVGMGRAISDGVSDAYIQDVTVLSTYRGRGLGSRIVQCLVAELTRRGIDWVGLVAMPGTASFYEPLGFEPMADFVPMKYKHQD